MKKKPFKDTIRDCFPGIPVAAFSRSRRSASGDMPLAYHPEYEFHLIKCGHGAYYIEGQTYYFSPNNLVIIRPNQIHNYVPQNNERVETTSVLFQGEWMKDVLRELDIDKTLPALIDLHNYAATCIEMIIKRMVAENARQQKGWEGMIHELLHEFLLWVRRVKDCPIDAKQVNPLFAQLRGHIESHFAEPLCNVAHLAEQFGYSANYLSALFKEANGMGLKQYLLQYRIIVARQLIEQDPMLKMEAVARQVGFNEYRNFSRAFFALAGVCPENYRRNCHGHR